MRFIVLHNGHHKVSQSVPFFMHCKTMTILLKISVRGHYVMPITKNHVTELDNPPVMQCLDGVDIWMGDHLDRIPCAVLRGKSGWRSGHQSRLPPLLQMLYVD